MSNCTPSRRVNYAFEHVCNEWNPADSGYFEGLVTMGLPFATFSILFVLAVVFFYIGRYEFDVCGSRKPKKGGYGRIQTGIIRGILAISCFIILVLVCAVTIQQNNRLSDAIDIFFSNMTNAAEGLRTDTQATKTSLQHDYSALNKFLYRPSTEEEKWNTTLNLLSENAEIMFETTTKSKVSASSYNQYRDVTTSVAIGFVIFVAIVGLLGACISSPWLLGLMCLTGCWSLFLAWTAYGIHYPLQHMNDDFCGALDPIVQSDSIDDSSAGLLFLFIDCFDSGVVDDVYSQISQLNRSVTTYNNVYPNMANRTLPLLDRIVRNWDPIGQCSYLKAAYTDTNNLLCCPNDVCGSGYDSLKRLAGSFIAIGVLLCIAVATESIGLKWLVYPEKRAKNTFLENFRFKLRNFFVGEAERSKSKKPKSKNLTMMRSELQQRRGVELKSTAMHPKDKSKGGYKTFRKRARENKKQMGVMKSRFSVTTQVLDLAAKNPDAWNSLRLRFVIKLFVLFSLSLFTFFMIILIREFVIPGGSTWLSLSFPEIDIQGRTLSLVAELGYFNFIVRLSGFTSVDDCNTFAGYSGFTDLSCDFPDVSWTNKYSADDAFNQIPWMKTVLFAFLCIHIAFTLAQSCLLLRAKRHRLYFKFMSSTEFMLMVISLVFFWAPTWETDNIFTLISNTSFGLDVPEAGTISLDLPSQGGTPTSILLSIAVCFAWLLTVASLTTKQAHRSIYKAELRAELEDYFDGNEEEGFVPDDEEISSSRSPSPEEESYTYPDEGDSSDQQEELSQSYTNTSSSSEVQQAARPVYQPRKQSSSQHDEESPEESPEASETPDIVDFGAQHSPVLPSVEYLVGHSDSDSALSVSVQPESESEGSDSSGDDSGSYSQSPQLRSTSDSFTGSNTSSFSSG